MLLALSSKSSLDDRQEAWTFDVLKELGPFGILVAIDYSGTIEAPQEQRSWHLVIADFLFEDFLTAVPRSPFATVKRSLVAVVKRGRQFVKCHLSR